MPLMYFGYTSYTFMKYTAIITIKKCYYLLNETHFICSFFITQKLDMEVT